jgi:hypothetical protein
VREAAHIPDVAEEDLALGFGFEKLVLFGGENEAPVNLAAVGPPVPNVWHS